MFFGFLSWYHLPCICNSLELESVILHGIYWMYILIIYINVHIYILHICKGHASLPILDVAKQRRLCQQELVLPNYGPWCLGSLEVWIWVHQWGIHMLASIMSHSGLPNWEGGYHSSCTSPIDPPGSLIQGWHWTHTSSNILNIHGKRTWTWHPTAKVLRSSQRPTSINLYNIIYI